MPPGVHVVAPPAREASHCPAPQLYSTLSPAGVFQKLRFSLGPDLVCIWPVSSSGSLQHVLCGGVAEFGVLPISPRTRFPAGDVWYQCHGISLNYDTYHPRRGGSPSEESGTLRFCDARLLGIDETRVLSNRNSGVTTPHPQGASCAIHA
jgi:hypothetical protein